MLVKQRFFLAPLRLDGSLDPLGESGRGRLQDVDQTAGDAVAVGQHPHLQGAVGAAGEDSVAGSSLHLHDAGADVAEDGLLGVLGAEGMHEPVSGQFPHLEVLREEKKTLVIY